MKTALLLFLLTAVQAHVALEKRQAPAFCSRVTKLVSSSCQPYVTVFCSSYVQVPLSTSTTTTSTITKPRSTATVTTTVSRGSTITRTSTVTTTDTSEVTQTACSGNREKRAVIAKRQTSTKSFPPCLTTSYKPGPSLSSACSCLSVKPSTTTVSVAATVTRGISTTTITSTRNGRQTTTVTTTVGAQTSVCVQANNLLSDPGFEQQSSSWRFNSQSGFFNPGEDSSESAYLTVGSDYGQSDATVIQYLGGDKGIQPRGSYQVAFSYNIDQVVGGGTYEIETRYSVDTSLDSFTFTPEDAQSGWIVRVIDTTIPYAYGDLTIKLHYPYDLSESDTTATVYIDNVWFFQR